MAQRDANWVDGLRGISSFMVVTGHIFTSFFPYLHAPPEQSGKTLVFQLPFFRLFVGGRTAVAMFFVITGYVNAIGTISRARSGNTDAAFSSLARSALARTGRLLIPTVIATAIAWLLAQLNAYKMAEHVDATWIRQGYMAPDATFVGAIYKLLKAQVSTWTTGWNEYDGTQWTLVLFVQGSMIVYVTLLATMLVKPRARRLAFAGLYCYAWLCPSLETTVMTMNIAVGMMLADLHVELDKAATSYVPRIVPPILLLLGLFCAGYPQQDHGRMVWSKVMHRTMTALVPRDADTRRYWDSIAATLIIHAAFFSARFRRVLSNSVFNFLGRVSFPVYLTHNQLIKSVLVWLVYFPSFLNPPVDPKTGKQKDLVRAHFVHLVLALVVFYYILYRFAIVWTGHVDPVIGRMIKRATAWAMDDSSPIEKSIVAAAAAADAAVAAAAASASGGGSAASPRAVEAGLVAHPPTTPGSAGFPLMSPYTANPSGGFSSPPASDPNRLD